MSAAVMQNTLNTRPSSAKPAKLVRTLQVVARKHVRRARLVRPDTNVTAQVPKSFAKLDTIHPVGKMCANHAVRMICTVSQEPHHAQYVKQGTSRRVEQQRHVPRASRTKASAPMANSSSRQRDDRLIIAARVKPRTSLPKITLVWHVPLVTPVTEARTRRGVSPDILLTVASHNAISAVTTTSIHYMRLSSAQLARLGPTRQVARH